MKKLLSIFITVLISIGFLSNYVYAKKPKDKVKYVKYVPDKVIMEMVEQNKKKTAEARKKTQAIIKKFQEKRKKARKERKIIRLDVSKIKRPSSPKVFKQVWHFPPVPQYLTGTCWDFSATSFMESEIYRLSKQKIKLSEIHTAYYEYIEKAKEFVKTRGNSAFEEGSESNALIRIWKKYGVVPKNIYKGVLRKDGRHDHSQMFREMKNYLKFIKEHNYWDEKEVVAYIKIILNKYLGTPPKTFDYNGKTYTPKEFLSKVLKINLDDYVGFMSTLSIPFWTQGEFKVTDNWWHSKDYYNVPLNIFYSIIKKAINKGYSITIGGDVSEPGYYGEKDIAIVPTFDIPQEYINQDSREFRIYNRTTGDDHGIHLIGYKRFAGHDWFLIKDSARSSRHGKFKGYYFYREDYIKLKMLTIMLHKDVVKDILKRFDKNIKK
jgi:bleomycin hydrolase